MSHDEETGMTITRNVSAGSGRGTPAVVRGGDGRGGRWRANHRRRQGASELAEPRTDVWGAALQPAGEDHDGQRGPARSRVVARHREPNRARRGGHADRGRRRDVHDGRLEPRARPRRQDRQAPVGVRSANLRSVRRQGMLRRGQPRRRRLGGQGLRRRLRWPADRARCEDGQEGVGDAHRRPVAGLHHQRRAPSREGQGDHRQRRRRLRRARVRLGL